MQPGWAPRWITGRRSAWKRSHAASTSFFGARLKGWKTIPGLRLIGAAKERDAVLSFVPDSMRHG